MFRFGSGYNLIITRTYKRTFNISHISMVKSFQNFESQKKNKLVFTEITLYAFLCNALELTQIVRRLERNLN